MVQAESDIGPLIRVFFQQVAHETLSHTGNIRRVEDVPVPSLVHVATLAFPVTDLVLKGSEST